MKARKGMKSPDMEEKKPKGKVEVKFFKKGGKMFAKGGKMKNC